MLKHIRRVNSGFVITFTFHKTYSSEITLIWRNKYIISLTLQIAVYCDAIYRTITHRDICYKSICSHVPIN